MYIFNDVSTNKKGLENREMSLKNLANDYRSSGERDRAADFVSF